MAQSYKIIDKKDYDRKMAALKERHKKYLCSYRFGEAFRVSAEITALDRQYKSQQLSIAETVQDPDLNHDILVKVVQIAILSDILNGCLVELKGMFRKAGIASSDAYKSASAASRLANEVVADMDKAGRNVSIILCKATEEIENKYMHGMLNDISTFLHKTIEVDERGLPIDGRDQIQGEGAGQES